MRELFVPCRSGTTGRRITLGIGPYGSPVATIRRWRRPFEDRGWGVFIGIRRTQVFQPASMQIEFDTVTKAREAADTKVGRWMPSGEVVVRPWEV
jgi:hypothetical protein